MSPRTNAIVTGAAGGIGRTICLELGRRGHHVVATDIGEQGLNALGEALAAAHISYTLVPADITKSEDLDRIVATVDSVAVLANNAGIFNTISFEDLTADDYRRQFETNVIAASELSRRAMEKMDRGSAIVNTVSIAMHGGWYMTHYTASKAALAGVTRSLALALAAKGIRVNAVAPGAIATPMLLDRQDDKAALVISRIPMGAYGRPEDIAAAVGFLSSDEARYVTGAILPVDGGRSLMGA